MQVIISKPFALSMTLKQVCVTFFDICIHMCMLPKVEPFSYLQSCLTTELLGNLHINIYTI